MRPDKAAFAASPVAHRVFDLLIRTAVRRLGEGRESAPLEPMCCIMPSRNRNYHWVALRGTG